MRMLCEDRLALTDPETIRCLLGELAASHRPLLADAAEILPNSTVWIREVRDQYFTVETEYLPNDILAVPLSSWRVTITLDGATLCLTTVSLARIDAAVFGLAFPEEIVSGTGRRHYRVSVAQGDTFQVSLLQPNRTMQAEVVDASFSDLDARLVNAAECPIEAEHKIILAGRHHGVLFKEPATVIWRDGEIVGIALNDDEYMSPIEDRPWSHAVRRMAYDQFMRHLRAA